MGLFDLFKKNSVPNEVPRSYKNIEEELISLANTNTLMDVKGYTDYILESGGGIMGVTPNIAKAFVGVLTSYSKHGKSKALDNYDKLIRFELDKLASTNASPNAFFFPSFLCGLLLPNGVVSEEESNQLSEKYTQVALSMMNKK